MSKAKKKTAEIVTLDTSAKLPAFGAFKVARQVTLPTIKLVENVPLCLRATGTITQGKRLKEDEETKGREPASIMPVEQLDPETGEVQLTGQIVLGSVLKSNLEEAYPDASYVGKIFGIMKGSKPEGKRYNQYQILELST